MDRERKMMKRFPGIAHISEVQKRNVEVEGAKYGKPLIMKKVLLKP